MSSPASGPEVAGVFTPDDGMASEIDAAARDAGEAFWRMPMRESYWEQMKSEIADMKNTGTRRREHHRGVVFEAVRRERRREVGASVHRRAGVGRQEGRCDRVRRRDARVVDLERREVIDVHGGVARTVR